MSNPAELGDTTRVEFTESSILMESKLTASESPGSADSTVSDAAPTENFGIGKKQLVDQYKALLRAGGIYYPVAYQFLQELGRGRQGVVFLGLRQGARGCITRHAIKLFDPSIYPNARRYWTDMGRIASQISQLQSVRTPFLASRETYEESNGIGYVQMEAIDGMDLSHFVRKRQLERAKENASEAEWERFTNTIFRQQGENLSVQPGIAVYIMRQILRALEVLHEHGFVHSDVKPSNVMIDRLGNARVIDFGRAVRIGEKVSMLLGTPYYMAPETHRREPGRAQSDLFSVGMMGIEMLCGRNLMASNNEEELLAFKLELPDRLHEILPEHVRKSSTLVEILRGFIFQDPDRRFGSARAAESGPRGLLNMHRELARMEVDANYGRELEGYLSKFANPMTKRIEI
jgi:serine/threonine protein kinase